jgi:hypothetical protein
VFRLGIGGSSSTSSEDEGQGLELSPVHPPAVVKPAPVLETSLTEHLDTRPPSPKNGRLEPRVLLVEHPNADVETRWSRALELLLEAGIRTTTDTEGDN